MFGGFSAEGGNRTHTPLAGPRILSPVRLPVPPPRRGSVSESILTCEGVTAEIVSSSHACRLGWRRAGLVVFVQKRMSVVECAAQKRSRRLISLIVSRSRIIRRCVGSLARELGYRPHRSAEIGPGRYGLRVAGARARLLAPSPIVFTGGRQPARRLGVGVRPMAFGPGARSGRAAR